MTIAVIGVGPCFLLNGASYIAVIVALMVLDGATMLPKVITPRAKGQVREGLRYVWRTPTLRTPLLMMFVIGTLAYEFQVILPVMAEFTFHGDAGTYGVMTAAMGVGAVVGGLFVAGKSHHGIDALVRVSVIFGVVIALLAVAPTLPVAIAALVLVGAASITFLARANTTLQLSSDPAHAGPGDGPVDGGLPRQHADRRADHRLDRAVHRAPVGPGDGVHVVLRRRRSRRLADVVHRPAVLDRGGGRYRLSSGASGSGRRSPVAIWRAIHSARAT